MTTPTPDVDPKLKLDTKAQIDFACDVLRVVRYIVKRIQLEQRKSWKTEDLLKLVDTLLVDIATGITEEDVQRRVHTEQGKRGYTENKAREDNPYRQPSKQYLWWDTGWRDAQRESMTKPRTPSRRFATKETEQPQHFYKIQLSKSGEITEWNETLHMYVAQGGGSLFSDYEEANALANRFRSDKMGIVTLITVEPEPEKVDPERIEMEPVVEPDTHKEK